MSVSTPISKKIFYSALPAAVAVGCVATLICLNSINYQPAPTFSFLDPGAISVREQDLLVRFQPLREKLIAQYQNNPDFNVGLYFEYLPTGSTITVNTDLAMWPASLIKIPVALAVLKKIEDGEWQLSNELVILDEDKDASFGSLHKEPSGTTMTIEALLRATLVDSDNTAHFVLLRNIDATELEDVFFHLGLDELLQSLKNSPDSDEQDNRMTAKTYSVFFRSLFNATYLSPEKSEWCLRLIAEGRHEYLRSGLPETVMFAHKTGIRANEGVWADSGIVYVPRRPYIVTVMLEKRDPSSVVTEEQAEMLFKEISTQIYSYVTSL
jgi:beta-lactamase class A